MTRSERATQWRKDNPERFREIKRNSRLKAEFGITATQYDAMYANQNGKCAICNTQETSKSSHSAAPKALAVDHDHSTGKVRALLCSRCNQAVGMVKENFDTALNLAKYIHEHKGII